MDMKIRIIVLACLFGIAALSGCGYLFSADESEGDRCEPGDTECREDCVDGDCDQREPCQPGECADGEVCDESSGYCREGCLSDADCIDERFCDTDAKRCVCPSGLAECLGSMCCEVVDGESRQLAGADYRSLDLALGPDGRSHLVAQHSESNDVDYLLADTEDSYEAEPVAFADTPESIPGGQTLAVDQTGQPHIALLAVEGSHTASLQHATPSGGGWRVERVADTSEGSAIPSIVAPTAESVAIAYRGVRSDLLHRSHVLYVANDGGGWEESRLSREDFTGAPQLAVDRDGVVKMAFWDVRTESLRVIDPRQPEGGPGLASDMLIRAPSVAFDSNNRPHVVFWEFVEQQLVYAVFDGDAWQTERIGENRFGADPRLALDSGDRPHIVYVHEASNEVIWARRQDGAWQYSLVGRTVDGSYISSDRWVDIEITADDVVVIAYLESDGAVSEVRLEP